MTEALFMFVLDCCDCKTLGPGLPKASVRRRYCPPKYARIVYWFN